MGPSLYDAHCHLQDEWLVPHHAEIFAALEKINVRGAVVNGTCENDWPAVARLAAAHPWIIPSYGLHPWFIADRTPDWREKLLQQIAAGSCAIGEIGLDRWKEPYDFADQQAVFREQLAIAAERNLPVTIHCLQAWGVLAEILHSVPLPACGFLLHAYGGPAEMIPDFVKLGADFSFSGYFLHERKARQREAFTHVPLDRLLVETDAPAMPLPEERREYQLPEVEGKTPVNHPANLLITIQSLAALLQQPIEVLAAQIENNYHRLFSPVPGVAS
ncbi:MAG: TatD family hydrolase [Chthoniobacteraceae bacterium]